MTKTQLHEQKDMKASAKTNTPVILQGMESPIAQAVGLTAAVEICSRDAVINSRWLGTLHLLVMVKRP